MNKKEAINILAQFTSNHLTAGNFWLDAEYNDIVEALKKLYPKKKAKNERA